jgi:exodeoxyribonuclease-5
LISGTLRPSPLDLSADQERALREISLWWKNWGRFKQCFVVVGYAGTGKTELISRIAQSPGVVVAAMWGKAASVLRARGVDAKTIHGLIYIPWRDKRGNLSYRKRDSLPDVELIIIDEASVVDHVTFQDLLSFGLPILAVGDDGQLESIGTSGGFMPKPDIRLEQIHRQAEGNPILRLATAFRKNRAVPYWTDPNGKLRIAPRTEFWKLIDPAIQIVCGLNKTRHAVNSKVREALGAFGQLPQKGEKLICLKNNSRYAIFNGQQFICAGVGLMGGKWVELDLETEERQIISVPCALEQFGADPVKDHRDRKIAFFDYGYALTAHPAQGSEWPAVLVLEEIVKAWDRARWRYTAATRARERLVYCR